MFVPDGQSGRWRRPERICAGQNDKEGQAIPQDQFRLSGIVPRADESISHSLWMSSNAEAPPSMLTATSPPCPHQAPRICFPGSESLTWLARPRRPCPDSGGLDAVRDRAVVGAGLRGLFSRHGREYARLVGSSTRDGVRRGGVK